MMDNGEEYAGTLYIDEGFLDQSIAVDSPGHYIPNYPDAWATTHFPIKLNDVINCEELRPYNVEGRIRFYSPSGIQVNYTASGVINVTVSEVLISQYKELVNARMMVLNNNLEVKIPSNLTVTHADGTIDTYKIIDRR